MQKTVTKAVIPAAGFGTRMLPATKAQPKEMLVIVDKPVIQYVVEEAVQSGITDILIIISDGKQVLRDHFNPDEKLEALLKDKGKTEEFEAIVKLNRLCNIQFEYQHEQKGLGHAILCAEEFISNEPFAVLLGDTIIESKEPLMLQLANIFTTINQPVVALQQVPLSIAHRYGVFVGDKLNDTLYKGISVVEKPAKDNIPSNLVFAGRYVLTGDIFKYLKQTLAGVNNEIQLTDAFKLMMTNRTLYGHLFNGTRYDVGNKLDFIKTNLLIGLQRQDIGPQLKDWLQKINTD